MKHDLSISFCNVPCENPFFLSSSCVAGNYDMCSRALEAGWGGIVFKTIGFYQANEVSPRFDTLAHGGVPFGGFRNLEQISDHPLEENLDVLHRLKQAYPQKVLVASIMGETEDEWTKLAKLSEQAGVDLLECNFSCPQMTVKSMGSDVGQSEELVETYCRAVRKGTKLPILAKMTPNIGNMEPVAIAAIRGGADGIAAINTIKSITRLDVAHFNAYPDVDGQSSVSGYSGKAVRPIALRFVNDLARHPQLQNVPISGIGGIETWRDALEFILLGASNVQVTTAVMEYGYRIIDDMLDGLSEYMEEKEISQLSGLVGRALPHIVPSNALRRDYRVLPTFDHAACVGCGRCFLSCRDGAHQAIAWEKGPRKPHLLEEKCVGCHLCTLVCPTQAISPGKRVAKT
ncbi:NAD-dependent dihydropyrimidine dehydrogenase subunit PreA [Ethanoligenens sp.]|uniref:NAD-dependent dihydropyrimidine dehydrogenase subunit PreA n=1 Tax=Ethanoligenens sp. TaxID=2099655 RepID=UPI0039EA52D8